MDRNIELQPNLKTHSIYAKQYSNDLSGFLGVGFWRNCLSSNSKILVTSVLLFVVVLLLTYPKYLELLTDNNLRNHYSYFFHKIEAPLTPAVSSLETHAAKIDFRLTVPILAKVMGVKAQNATSIIFIYLTQSLLLIPFLFTLIKLLLKYLPPLSVLFLVIGVSSIYLAKAFIWDYDFWFDGFAYFFLLLGMYSRNRFAIFLILTLACWTDERAVVALLSVYLFHFLSENNFEIRSLDEAWHKRDWIKKKSTVVLFVGLCYVILRIYLSTRYGLHTPIGENSGVSFGLIPYQLKHRLVGIFLSFEGLWILYLIAIGQLIRTQRSLLASVMVGIMLIQIIIAYSVFDISRSMTYGFPLFIIAFILIYKLGFVLNKKLVGVSSFLCILIPTQYLIFFPRQIPWSLLSIEELRSIINVVI